ncbi:MAG: inositol monophosphatase [Cypionkella sp.]|uniref:inositol monophosphatase family protein n=1 Tax=Cypionkella sp. TaxID=2811411 RepID=UPI002ABC7A48|nr:inositol monophosphatase [Cypionkella sp.]MDZ4312951.1 inositol monophosphatase [Cypionkella sp.]
MILDELAIDQREAFCLDLARSAAILALDGFERQAGQPIGMKGPQDYLTETDGAVERHVRARIAKAFPSDGFLGEETGGTPGDIAWVVDPIDGTANFARSIPHFCISIAFVTSGEVQLGAILNPATDELYFARKGRGATRNGKAIHVAPTTDLQATSFELGWSNRVPLSRYIQSLTALFEAGSNVRRSASGAMALAYVADGRTDGYAELHMNSWDCLAGLLLVREAGGVTCAFLSLGGLIDGAPVLAASPAVAAVLATATGIPIFPGADILPAPTLTTLRTA